MLTFWSELGFVFPAFPFIAHSRGWDAEDMQNNVRQVRESGPLRAAAAELADRALPPGACWTTIGRSWRGPWPGRDARRIRLPACPKRGAMSDRMRIARAYEASLFAGRMDEVGRR